MRRFHLRRPSGCWGNWSWFIPPKHGSWLHMDEIELCALGRQCTEGRLHDLPTLIEMVRIWERDRNNRSIKIDWQFTTEDARITLRRLYPKIMD